MSYGLVISIIGALIAFLSAFADQILSTSQATAANPDVFGPAQISGVCMGVFIALCGIALIIKFPKKKLARDTSINIALCLGSVSTTYLIIEFLVFPNFIHLIPIKFHTYLPEPIQVLAQSSKNGTTPKSPYVVILGDSYAQGLGDWLLDSNKNRNPPFHSAHILHENYDQDVISIGQGGAGSISSMVILPKRRLTPLLSNEFGISIPPPSKMIVYFYEGNDLTDNIQRFERYTDKIIGPKSDATPVIEEIINASLSDSANTIIHPTASGRLLFFQLIKNIVFNFHFGWHPPSNARTKGGTEAGKDRYDTNYVLASGQKTALRNKLQSPPIHLSQNELNISIQMFSAALQNLKNTFPKTELIVAYIPSVLMSYQIISNNVSISGSPSPAATEQIIMTSNSICHQILATTNSLNIPLLDLRTSIQKYALKSGILHGTKDWEHFNKIGYTFLGKEIGIRMRELPKTSRCDKIKNLWRHQSSRK